MNAPRRDSLAELLLVAAESLRDVWTLEDLAVQAHCSFRNRFSMYGHDLPCTHRVHSVIYGARGLVARGFVAEANGVQGHPYFRLTEAGRHVAAQRRRNRAREPVMPPPAPPIRPLAALPPEPAPAPTIQATATELNLFRIGKQGEAILRLIQRYRSQGQPVTGREADGALQQADAVCMAPGVTQDDVLVEKSGKANEAVIGAWR